MQTLRLTRAGFARPAWFSASMTSAYVTGSTVPTARCSYRSSGQMSWVETLVMAPAPVCSADEELASVAFGCTTSSVCVKISV